MICSRSKPAVKVSVAETSPLEDLNHQVSRMNWFDFCRSHCQMD